MVMPSQGFDSLVTSQIVDTVIKHTLTDPAISHEMVERVKKLLTGDQTCNM